MRTLPIDQHRVKFNNFKSESKDVKEAKVTEVLLVKDPAVENKPSKEKKIALVSAALAIASLGVAVYSRKNNKVALEEAMNKAKGEMQSKVEEAEKKAAEAIKKAEEVAKKAEENAKTIQEKQKWNDGYLESVDNKVKKVEEKLEGKIEEAKRPVEKNLAYVNGFTLLQNLDNGGRRIALKPEVIKELQATSPRYMNKKSAGAATLATLTASSTVWLPTAESLPEKEGGLAEVPVQMAMNFDKMDINNYIVRPLMEVPGKTEFVEKDGKYYYYYPGLDVNEKDETTGKMKKVPKPLELQKVAEFETKAFRNGQYETQPVEVFYAVDSVRGYKRLMFRNKDYFNASGLYNSTQMVSEPERYTFFNKVMYDFIKLRLDPKSVQGAKINNSEIFESIKTPDAIALNDWHTAPMAALLRYKAPVEASRDELNGKVAQKLKDMNLLYIVHNSDYQGDDYVNKSEILNTLFDKYALDIYENAATGFFNGNLWNSLLIDNNINMANMGMTLAHKVKPVSRTYANDMATRPERSRGLMHVTAHRLNEGTLEGASNGWDRAANEIAPGSGVYNGTVAMINKDRAFIQDVLKNNPDFKYELPPEREVKPITSTMDINELMQNAAHNKKMFVEYLKSCLTYNWVAGEYNSKVADDKKVPLINFDANGVSDLSDVDVNKLGEIPVLTMGVRFTDQKGVDIVTKSLVDLYNNWEKDYPGKELPIVVIGGEDKEGPYRELAQNAKRILGEKGKRLLYMDGFTPNPAFYAGSDFTLRPSHFEPDGDKWESLYRGTPMIMTRVGGHVDSIKDGFNGFLSRRTVSDICAEKHIDNIKVDGKYNEAYLNAMAEDYLEAIKRGLDAFYDKEQYKQLVDNAIHGDQSWVQRDENGLIKECPLVSHMRDLGFDLKDPSLAYKFSESVKK